MLVHEVFGFVDGDFVVGFVGCDVVRLVDVVVEFDVVGLLHCLFPRSLLVLRFLLLVFILVDFVRDGAVGVAVHIFIIIVLYIWIKQSLGFSCDSFGYHVCCDV